MDWYDPLLHKDDPRRDIGEAAPAAAAAPAPVPPVVDDAPADEDMLGFDAFIPAAGSVPEPAYIDVPEPEQPAEPELPKASEVVIPTSMIDALMADPEILRASNRVIAAGQSWADQQDEKDLTDDKLKAKLTELTKAEAKRNPKLPIAAVVTRGMRAISGFYGLERFLDDPKVTDIVINGCKNVMVSSFGAPKRKFEGMFPTDATTAALLAKLLKETGEDRPTVEHPRLDGQFLYRDGSPDGNLVRVNAIISSNTVTKERYFSLRKRMTAIGDIDTLEAWTRGDDPDISPVGARALAAFIRYKATLIIAGATGSGKTTFLRACIREIPGDERIVTIEDSSELVLTHEDYAPLVAHGKTGIGELMENAMRMVPERIILGECRKSVEVGGFLEAINTGHDGSITTTHASSAEDALYRLLTLAAASARAGSSENFVGRQIASGVDLVVFINAQINPVTKSRRRKIAEIMAVDSFSGEGGPHFMLKPMFGRWSDPANPDSLPEMSAPLRCAGAGRIRHGRFWRRMMAQGMSDEEMTGLLPMEGLDADDYSAERN